VWQSQKLLNILCSKSPKDTFLRSDWAVFTNPVSPLEEQDCLPATLTRLAATGDYYQYLLEKHKDFLLLSASYLPSRFTSYIDASHTSLATTTYILRTIDTKLEETRRFEYVSCAMDCIISVPPEAHEFVEKVHCDYAMTLVTQCNLARLQLFQGMGMALISRVVLDNSDKV
jgi:hypothetical protein